MRKSLRGKGLIFVELSSFEAIIRALNGNGVRYLVVGGMAVVVHGHGRMTHDLDLVVALDHDNVLRAFAALQGLDYSPRVPVTAAQFADDRDDIRHLQILQDQCDRKGDLP